MHLKDIFKNILKVMFDSKLSFIYTKSSNIEDKGKYFFL